MDFQQRLKTTNTRLKTAKIKVSISQRGDRLFLRATLPPPPGSVKAKPYQQRLATGLPANPRGLKLAETKAKRLGVALEAESFAWSDYRGEKTQTVAQWVNRFYHERFTASETTWKTNYQAPFQKLPTDAPLTLELLKQTLEQIRQQRPDSRTQLKAYIAYRQLLKFAGLSDEVLLTLKGNYSASAVDPRSLPSDAEISAWRETIKNPGWRWIFGMLATYGLRGHEVFRADLTDLPTLRISSDNKTKRGRYCWPLYPEWVNQWDLKNSSLPKIANIEKLNNATLGHRVSMFFNRRIPCVAYDLRHCYARRSFEFGFSPEFAAKMMGHSPDVHCRVYRRWIDEEVYRRIYDQLVNRSDRPQCPPKTED